MLGKNLKKIREAKKISQRKLARMIGISGQMISKIENGGANPSLATLKKIAAALDVPISALFPHFETAKKLIDRIAGNSWRVPRDIVPHEYKPVEIEFF